MRSLVFAAVLALGCGAGAGPGTQSGELWAIDLESGARSLIHTFSTEDLFVRDMALDSTTGHLYLVTHTFLVRLDTLSGTEVTISDDSTGSGPPLRNADALALDAGNERAFVLNIIPQAVLELDLRSGDRRLLSDASNGTGPAIGSLARLAYDPLRNRLFAVTNARLGPGDVEGAVLEVDLVTGDRTLVSGQSTGRGPPLSLVNDIRVTLDATAELAFAHSRDGLWEIDLVSGDRRLIHAVDTIETHPFGQPSSLAFDADGQRLLEMNESGLREIEPATSVSIVVSGPDQPPALVTMAISLDRARSRVLAFGSSR